MGIHTNFVLRSTIHNNYFRVYTNFKSLSYFIVFIINTVRRTVFHIYLCEKTAIDNLCHNRQPLFIISGTSQLHVTWFLSLVGNNGMEC